MKPKSWRISSDLTLNDLSKKGGGISTGYLSECENGIKEASGRVIKLYHKLSKGIVTPSDFKVKK